MLKRTINFLRAYFPGLVLVSWIAGVSILICTYLGFVFLSPLLISGLLGVFIRNFIGISKYDLLGVALSAKRILRLAIILLGLRISLSQIFEIGLSGLVVIYFCCFSSFLFTCWLGNKLKVDFRLTQLIASGTSICGASAIVATSPVLDSSEEDVAYSIALVTCLGTVAMLGYPIIANIAELNPTIFGLWCGTSIHEVAQVIAASFQLGESSGEVATIAKLSRVMLIVPLLTYLSFQKKLSQNFDNSKNESHSFPWFVLFFFLLVLINSLNYIPQEIVRPILTLNQFLLSMAMAAMVLLTSINALKRIGFRPIYLASLSWLYLGIVSLLLLRFYVAV